MSSLKLHTLGILIAGLLTPAAVTAETHRYVPKKEDLKYTFATAPPVLRLNPGDTLETWTESAFGDSAGKPRASRRLGIL